MPRKKGDHIPWWEIRGNNFLRKIFPNMLVDERPKIESHYLNEQAIKDPDRKRITGLYYFGRAFVLNIIKRDLIDHLYPKLSKEEIIQLVEEAFDFDLEAYKREWYKAHPNED